MKKFLFSTALAIASLWSFGCFSAFAQGDAVEFRDLIPAALQVPANIEFATQATPMSQYSTGTLDTSGIKESNAIAPVAGTRALPSSIAEEYVMTVKSLRPDLYGDTGNCVTVQPIADKDSVWLLNFWSNGTNIKAAVDLAKGTVSIPNQKIGINDNGVTVDISSCDALGKPTRNKNIEGVINPDGTISIPTWWGLFAFDGPDKDRYAFVGGDTEMERANATMSFSFLDGTKVKFGVVVTQPYDNQVIVKNFANYGQSVKIWLDSSRGGYIPSQCAQIYPANKANFMTMAVADYTSTGNPTAMAKNISLIPAATDNTTTLNWGKWSAFSIGTANMFFGPIIDGKIEFNAGFRYPKVLEGSFDGAGTEADPYLIKSVMDFVRMADYVNSYTQTKPDTIGGFVSHLAYTGKYFKLASDLDISSRLLTPIGGDLNHLFNGSFDGAGYTLTGLAQEVGGAGLAGLFGMCGPQSVIKNVTIKDASISAEGLIASVLAGWTYGTLTGCGSINAKVTNTQRIASGLVGAAETISDCFVENAYIDGKGGNSAGLAGQVNVSIENCSVTNTTILAGSGADGYPAGGVVASMNGAKGKNLYFSGSIDSKVYMSTMTIGGIAGILSHGSLENSFAVGTITSGVSTTGRNAVAGGVVGTMYGSELSDSYFVGVAGTYYSRMAGGITGWVKPYTDSTGTVSQPVIKNCYTASVITSETYLYDSAKEVRESLGWIDETATPTIENVYFDNQYTNLNSKLYGVPGSYLTSATGPDGFSKDKWLIAEGQYPRLKNLADNQAAMMSASAILMAPQSSLKKLAANAALRPLGDTKFSLMNNGKFSTEGHFCKIQNDSIVISSEFGTDTLAIQNGKMTLLYELKVAPVPFAGEGTEINPYLISTKQDVIALGHITSVVKQYFPQSYFLMTNDIDMEYDPAFRGICIDPDAYCKFAGVFDGGGHTLDNVLEEWVEWTKKPVDENDVTGNPNTNSNNTQNVKGIFGRLAEGAIIRNLTAGAGCKFVFWARSGAIVGQNEGLVENCRNFARIATLSSVAGGIVGENRKGIVRKCYNAGEVVSGYNAVGGIVGTGNGIIEECVNTGNVSLKVLSTFQKLSSSMSKAGGIQGENTGTNFINCVNFGTVSSYQNLAGGIVAQLSKISSTTVLGDNSVKNTINLGVVNVEVDRTQMGAIGGNSGTTGTIEGVYWDNQIIPLKAQGGLTLEGASGIETAKLISGEPLAGYDTSIWNFEKGKYPVIAQFASEPKVQEARSLILLLAEGTNVDNLTDGGTLEAPTTATWSLKQNKDFKIEGNKLVSPADVKESVSDVLTLSLGSFSKVLNISCPPAIPLAGSGTETNPYQITSPTDWNALADYAALTRKDFEGKYLKVTQDIDFANGTFKSLFGDGITNFAGTLDGDSHTVKGIKMTTTATYQGAIGTITSEATVKNLTLAGEITTAQQYTGGFTGRVYGKIQNCENAISVTSTKAAVAGFGYIYGGAELTDVVNSGKISGSAGSVAGIASYTTDGVKFTRVVNKGIVESTATGTATYIGGLVAQCQPAIFEACGNEGSFVIKTPTSANSVGGLVAYANAAAGHTVDYTFTDCYNRAEITANNILGGIVANTVAAAANVSPLLMTNCVNYAAITSVATKATTSSPTAGIAAFYNPGSKIENCVNEGKVTSAFNVYASGIVGQNKTAASATAPVLIKDCVNKGDIEAKGNQGAGIMAISTNNVTITGCYNTGKLTGGWGIAGIIAQLGGNDVEIAYSWNAGDIESSSYRVGGLIGWNTVVGNVHDCYNLGNVSTTCETGGTSTSATAPSGYSIGGLAGYSASVFKRCYNMGDVKGASAVGGLVGLPYKNRTVIDSCYNAGKIIAPADTCGYIIGVNPKSNGANWNTDNKISNSYYVKNSGELRDGELATGMTETQFAAVELGKGWNSGDAYTYPMITGAESDEAKVYAARVITDDPAGELKVTGPFHVGLPEGLRWSSDNTSVEFNGNDVTIKGKYQGKVTLTATCGDATRSVVVEADTTSSVTDLEADKDYVEIFYTLDGMQVPAESLDKGVYIRVRTYSDGRSETTRIIR